MTPQKDKEFQTAWRLFHLLNELSNLLWECYEPEFINREQSEQELRWSYTESGEQSKQEYPF